MPRVVIGRLLKQMSNRVLNEEISRTLWFYEFFIMTHDAQIKAVCDQAEKLSETDENFDHLSNDLNEFGSIKRIAHAAVLLKLYQVVETWVKNAVEQVHLAVYEDHVAAVTDVVKESLAEGREAGERDQLTREKVGQAMACARVVWEGERSLRQGLADMDKELRRYRNSQSETIDIRCLPMHSEVDLLRLLVNSFKHSNGVILYSVDDVPDEKSEQRILKYFEVDWRMQPECRHRFAIPYEKVDVLQFINHVERFCKALTESLGNFIEATPILPKAGSS